jgi:chromosome segregation ATPase
VANIVGQYDSEFTPIKPSRHPTGLLTPPDTLRVDRTAYNHLTEELRTKETNLEQAQQDLAKEREDAFVKLKEQDEMHTRALEDKDAEIKANVERIATLVESLSSLEEKIDEIKCQKQLLDEQNTHDRARILELEEQMSALRAEYNEIFTSLNTANNTIPALHEELDAQRATVAKLRATIDGLTRQCELLEDKNKTQSEVIARRKKHSLDLVHALAQSLTDVDLPFVRVNMAGLMM